MSTTIKTSPPLCHSSRVRLIVLEREGKLCDFRGLLLANGLDTDVVVQGLDEKPGDFLLRLRGRTAALAREHRHIGEAFFVVGETSSAELFAARSAIALALLTAAGSGSSAVPLVLVGAESADGHGQSELFELAEALLRANGSTRASVRIRFSTPRTKERGHSRGNLAHSGAIASPTRRSLPIVFARNQAASSNGGPP